MNVIVFASRKGGSGKSTLTAHLAAQAHRPSRPVLLIDCDPQGSLTLWHKLRGGGEPPLRAAIDGVSDLIKAARRSEEHTSELQSPDHLVCRLLLEKKKNRLQRTMHRIVFSA